MKSKSIPAQIKDVFGFKVPTSDYYLHRGHTWAVIEDNGQVRVGLDDFSQKLMGPADGLKLPEVGKVYYQDHICMSLLREGSKASVEAPVDGHVAEINPQVQQRPGLIHEDPYGAGWLFKVQPINLQRNLENLFYGEPNAIWIDQEAHRLIYIMDTTVGATLPSGGTVIDDVIGHYPNLGWRRMVKEFLLTNVTKNWQKR